MAHTLTAPPPGRFFALSTIDGKSIVSRKQARRWIRSGRAIPVSDCVIRMVESHPGHIAGLCQSARKPYFPADTELERKGAEWRWWKGISAGASVMKATHNRALS